VPTLPTRYSDTAYKIDLWSACVREQSLVEEKVRQLQTENARLQASLDEERQQNAAVKQQTCDLQLVSQRTPCIAVYFLPVSPSFARTRPPSPSHYQATVFFGPVTVESLACNS